MKLHPFSGRIITACPSSRSWTTCPATLWSAPAARMSTHHPCVAAGRGGRPGQDVIGAWVGAWHLLPFGAAPLQDKSNVPGAAGGKTNRPRVGRGGSTDAVEAVPVSRIWVTPLNVERLLTLSRRPSPMGSTRRWWRQRSRGSSRRVARGCITGSDETRSGCR
jgi:hypothetical protein